MSVPYTIESIAVTDLQLNIANPRFEAVDNQRAAVNRMLLSQEEKIVRLAEDIVANGLNPSETLIITRDLENPRKCTVLEGNRRTTVLKLLIHPDTADAQFKMIHSPRFRKAVDTFNANPIKRVSCAVFANEEDANRWIRLRHTGENRGVGTASWNAQQIARFDAKERGKATSALQIIDYLGKSKTFDPALKAQLPKVNISTLDRLVGTTDVKSFLGISLKSGKLYSTIASLEIERGLTKIVGDLLTNNLTARSIDKKTDRQKYIRGFPEQFVPNKDIVTSSEWALAVPEDSVVLSPKESSDKSESTTKTGRSRTTPLSTDRENVIPKSCVLGINASHKRINKIYKELRDLPLSTFENAAGVLFRVFIELSTDTYLAKYPATKLNQKAHLKDKVAVVTAHMEANGFATDQMLKGIKVAVTNSNDILSLTTFNAYVHNPYYSPDPLTLKTSWDNIQPYVETIWQNV